LARDQGELARHVAAGLADVDRGAGQLAAVDGDHLHAAHGLLSLLVAQHQQRERYDVGGVRTEVLHDIVREHPLGTLVTHSAKGLEWDAVYVLHAADGNIPSDMSTGHPEQIEEERRLFYVALTRAKENACFTYANQRYKWGNLDFCSPSRFLEELDPQYLDQSISSAFQQTSRNRNSFNVESSTPQFKRPTSAPVFKSLHQQNIFGKKLVSLKESDDQSSFTADDPLKIQSGMVVEHQRFGEGKVLKIEGEMPNIKATIFFQSSGQKQLLLKFAKLKIKG